MLSHNLVKPFFLLAFISVQPIVGQAQQVKNVPAAFEALSAEPEVIVLANDIDVPTKSGHLQGVQAMVQDGAEKLLMSGSSLTQAYILQADLASRQTEKLIPLMKEPFRHAGGIQLTDTYLGVGIEDNVKKTESKLHLYNYHNEGLYEGKPVVTIDREGVPELKTSGATGILALENDYLIVVSNWDSRHWDFYRFDPNRVDRRIIYSFAAPADWGSYQSINLVRDEEAMYAIGFYKTADGNYADLILVSKAGPFEPVMRKVLTKAFHCKSGVSFGAAVGLQLDNEGILHVWATQPDAVKQITVNKFSQR
ncbi:hypothetical protein RT717_01740 [Imperialibacter roseus]|uniref:Uncharacterized protein n=1 Tax=Imperialibacter roseus TaxID=1324217 RepID=A0ABZ0IUP4_9BACT|nr:hypothetical protein [Imperialibacter roseus]WOK07342.1 hypothetical protein RT717_01740 [Imperialibacter roseus]